MESTEQGLHVVDVESLRKRLEEAEMGREAALKELSAVRAAADKMHKAACAVLEEKELWGKKLADAESALNKQGYGRYQEDMKQVLQERQEVMDAFLKISDEHETYFAHESIRLLYQSRNLSVEPEAEKVISDFRGLLEGMRRYNPYSQSSNTWLRERLKDSESRRRTEKYDLRREVKRAEEVSARYRAALDMVRGEALKGATPKTAVATQDEKEDEVARLLSTDSDPDSAAFLYWTERQKAWSLAASILEGALLEKTEVVSEGLTRDMFDFIREEILPYMRLKAHGITARDKPKRVRKKPVGQ